MRWLEDCLVQPQYTLCHKNPQLPNSEVDLEPANSAAVLA